MNEFALRIDKAKKLLSEQHLDAYIVPMSDAHMSEYLPEHDKFLAYMTGFTGSAGTLIISPYGCGLWADGRYHIQADEQLAGTGVRTFKAGTPECPTPAAWLCEQLPTGARVGISPFTVSKSLYDGYRARLERQAIKLDTSLSLADALWRDRPPLPEGRAFIHDIRYCGESCADKLARVRAKMREQGADAYLISALDDAAWLFNLRADDIHCNPVLICYALITQRDAYLLCAAGKLDEQVAAYLADNGVRVRGYDTMPELIEQLDQDTVILYDPAATNVYMADLAASRHRCLRRDDLITQLKCIKNETEITNLRKAFLKDSVAVTKLLCRLEEDVPKLALTELDAARLLDRYRREIDTYVSDSFDTISAYGPHSAVVHYAPTKQSDSILGCDGLYLLDCGGQFYDGTTDLTRTLCFGAPGKKMKHDFTLVLKAHIALADSTFLSGTTGANLEILSRKPLWDECEDFRHSTGHGVGFFLSVHEGPQRISLYANTPFYAGMVTSIEPGLYRQGRHGIRIENIYLTKKYRENEYGTFLRFDVLGFVPIQKKLIETSMLTFEELVWLNGYHQRVYDKLCPYLNEKEKTWLYEQCAPLS